MHQNRANAFSDIFGRPNVHSNSASPSNPTHHNNNNNPLIGPSYPQPPRSQHPPQPSGGGGNPHRTSPPPSTQGPAGASFGGINNGYNAPGGYGPPMSGQRSSSGGSYRDPAASDHYLGSQRGGGGGGTSHYPLEQGGQQQYAGYQSSYDQYNGGGGASRSQYSPAGSGPYYSPDPYQQSWTQAQGRHSPAQSEYASFDPSVAGGGGNRPQIPSPRSSYAPTVASGPSSASTSSLYPTSRSSPATSLQYSQSISSSNGTSRQNSTHSLSSPYSHPSNLPTTQQPPLSSSTPTLPALPEFEPTDDFYGFESSRAPDAPNSGTSRDPSAWGASGQGIPRHSSPGFMSDETDAFDSLIGAYSGSQNYEGQPSYTPVASPYDHSRRNSGQSDRTSLYRQTPPSNDNRPLLALNPSVLSLSTLNSQHQPQSPSNYNSTSPSLFSKRSSESMRITPTQSSVLSSSGQDRAFSFSSSTSRPDLMSSPHSADRPLSGSSIATGGPHSTSAVVPAPRRTPVVYPALLSRVAEAFKTRITVTERVKDGLVYSETFDGRDAVDKIAYIIKTTDRNLALLLGRALDAQKFFHDVTYDHRLRDSAMELYQFKERLSILSSDELVEGGGGVGGVQNSGVQSSTTHPTLSDVDTLSEETLPSGVFTLLTDCYSPTCTRDRLCYSIACPRRLEQQARLNLYPKPGLLKRSLSSESLGDLREPGSLWIHSVPQEVADSTSDSEKKRQEALNEVFYTERDFVRDMEYLRDSWIKPLRTLNIIPEARREDFISQVFWNVLEIYSVNVRLAELLNKRQKTGHVVEKVGDIFLEMVPHFGPFVKYGAHQLYGKYEFEKEKGSNPAFAKFVDDTERLPESRKLELNGYLTKPTTRLARYPLLLEACLKNTPDDNPDKVILPKVVKLVREFLNKVNVETGRSENRFNLAQLDQQLVFKNGEAVDLRLRDEDREMIFKGPLKKKGGTQSESAELQVFLFDHAVLMVKQKAKNEQYKVYRKPIPLELLVVVPVDDAASVRAGTSVRPRSLMSRGSTTKYLAQPPPGVDKNNKQGFAMTFVHLGRRGYQITLWAASWTGRKKWLEKIEARQHELRERSLVFETLPLSAGFFVGTNRVTCAAPFDNGNRMVYGTDNGVYLSDLRNKAKVPVKVVSVSNVTQLDVLEEQGILIVLADKAVQTFFVDNLDPGDAVGAAKRARKISSHATFFKAGQCLGRTLVCVVKSGSVSSTIKTLEPIDQVRGKKQPAIRKFLQGSNESLRVFKEFYIPTESSSVHFLKSKLCVGCTKGFEIVDLETLDTQGLLDPADSSLDFVQKRENARPIAIYRIEGDFLLCYDEFAFYVNKNGWRAKSNWIIQWEGFPTSFALHYPYVLAFEPTFVEVRHVESGALMQIIPGNNLKCLFADSPPSTSSSSMSNNNNNSYHSSASSQYSGYATSISSHQSQTRMLTATRTEIILSDNDRIYSLQCA